MTPAYLTSLQEALAKCQLAQAEAEAELSAAIINEYRMMRAHDLSGWNALMMRYPHNRAVEALATIAEFAGHVKGLQLRIASDGVEPDLSLTKTRPSFAGHGRHKAKD